MIEQLPYDAVRILHPECGGVVHVTDLEATEGVLRVEAICYRCDRYVTLELKTRLDAMVLPSGATLDAMNRLMITQSLDATQNVSRTARQLGVRRSHIYSAMERYGITPPRTERQQRRAKATT